MFKRLIVLSLLAASFLKAQQKPTNIILMIGDGMGTTQVLATRINKYGIEGKLNMEQMPVCALVTTFSANSLVTDSAAAATALATGCKTNNGMISMSPDGKKLTTVLEAAQKKKKSTGLVTTTTISDATPAAFAAHVRSRGSQDEIAKQLIENKVEILLGGGKAYFIPSTQEGSKRKDKLNLLELAKQQGYQFVETKEDLEKIKDGYVLGLFQSGFLTTSPPEPTLADLTSKAIEILSKNPNGFFLMVEGGQIDWECHLNDFEGMIKQTLDFDDAVKVASDFAENNKKTLVIVTADHETGGLTLKGRSKTEEKLDINWSTIGHTPMYAPLFALGPSADLFSGVIDNTDIAKIIFKLLE